MSTNSLSTVLSGISAANERLRTGEAESRKLAMIAFGNIHHDISGQVFVIFILTVAAAEAALALGLGHAEPPVERGTRRPGAGPGAAAFHRRPVAQRQECQACWSQSLDQ